MWLLRRSKTVLPRQSTRRRCRPLYDLLEDRIDPATFQVVDVTGLQAAIAAVNSNPTQQATINLNPGTYDLTSELQIHNASNLTIKGYSADKVIVDNPTHAARIFDIEGGNVTIDGLTITGGNAYGDIIQIGWGGGIWAASGTLTVNQSTISGNTADQGGGIATGSFTTLTVNQSTISGNTVDYKGGGIRASGGTLTVDQSTISGNTSGWGGGIWAASGTLTVIYSTISGNTAVLEPGVIYGPGGGIFLNGGTLTVNQSTISGNTAAQGGGIATGFFTTLTVNQSLIFGNSAVNYFGGGIDAYGSTLTVNQSLIFGNSAVQDGGGISAHDGSTLTVNYSLISGNSAVQGGGLYVSGGSQAEIDFSTINDLNGGGIVNNGSTVHLKKTVVDGAFYQDLYYV